MNKIAKIVIIIISIVVSLFILWIVVKAFVLVSRGVEVEGVVKYDDCRQVVTINESDSYHWYGYFNKQFTCSYLKTKSGFMMGGLCVLVNLDSNGTCVSAYVYQKQQDPRQCVGAEKDGVKYPYLGYDDNCYAKPQ